MEDIKTNKKGFNFLKKKKESEKIIEKNPTNDDMANMSNNDNISDTKSFQSLRINNNFKTENLNISKDLEGERQEEDTGNSVSNAPIESNNNSEKKKKTFNFVKNKQASNEEIEPKNNNNDEEKETEETLNVKKLNFFKFFIKISKKN